MNTMNRLSPTSSERFRKGSCKKWWNLVLLWNLMSTSDSVDKLTLNVISWKDDALIIDEQGHKGDEKGG